MMVCKWSRIKDGWEVNNKKSDDWATNRFSTEQKNWQMDSGKIVDFYHL